MRFGRKQQHKPGASSKARQARRNKKVSGGFVFTWNARYAWWLAGLCALVAIVGTWPRSELLPIERIQLSGSFKHLDIRAIERQLKPYLGTGFFAVDIQEIQYRLQQEPWIELVSVRRVWPRSLTISIREKQPYARWGKDMLLSSGGEVFVADVRGFSDLPSVTGYVGNSRKLLQKFDSMQQHFSDHGIRLSGLREDNKGALTLEIDGRLRVSLGSQDTARKIDHMLAVYQQQIANRAMQIDHIDFRYSNGFAINWNQQYLKQQNEARNRGGKNVKKG